MDFELYMRKKATKIKNDKLCVISNRKFPGIKITINRINDRCSQSE